MTTIKNPNAQMLRARRDLLSGIGKVDQNIEDYLIGNGERMMKRMMIAAVVLVALAGCSIPSASPNISTRVTSVHETNGAGWTNLHAEVRVENTGNCDVQVQGTAVFSLTTGGGVTAVGDEFTLPVDESTSYTISTGVDFDTEIDTATTDVYIVDYDEPASTFLGL